jgi:hypothetical protein
MTFYRQCVMRRGTIESVAWIPEEFAKVGKVLELREEDKTWTDGWRVVEAYKLRLPQTVVEKQERAHRDFSYN